jgi:hypothetical protein
MYVNTQCRIPEDCSVSSTAIAPRLKRGKVRVVFENSLISISQIYLRIVVLLIFGGGGENIEKKNSKCSRFFLRI